jgi:hypothetical protein
MLRHLFGTHLEITAVLLLSSRRGLQDSVASNKMMTVDQLVKNSVTFTKIKDSPPFLQNSAFGSYADLTEPSPHPKTVFL